MSSIKLTYMITTCNKQPFLKHVLDTLLAQVEPDEEVVVVDAGSTDGTLEYLENLARAGLVQQLVSEPDEGQSHGTNKACQKARGEVLVLITDDDAYYWPGIRACRDFMLEHPEVDAMGSEGAGTSWNRADPFDPSSYYLQYEDWKESGRPFSFCGNGILLRRSSLPLLGLFHTHFYRMDLEYTLRMTSGSANLAWCSSYNWVRIINPQSVTHNHAVRLMRESTLIEDLYLGFHQRPHPFRKWSRATAEMVRWALKPLRRRLHRPSENATFPTEWGQVFDLCGEWLQKQNEKKPREFLWTT